MNEFSLVCRILGTLFYRAPTEPALTPLLSLLENGHLAEQWPLEQSELLTRWQQSVKKERALLESDHLHLFSTSNGVVAPTRDAYTQETSEAYQQFLAQCGVPQATDIAIDHFGLILLAASWIEDHSADDEVQAQLTLFDTYLLPWYQQFLGKVEAHAQTDFYRVLAMITREALPALREELEEIIER